MTEDELLAEMIGAARKLGERPWHSTDPRRDTEPGFPDLVIGGPGGLLVAELKSASGVLSADQRAWRWYFRKAGIRHVVRRPADWADGTIKRELDSIA